MKISALDMFKYVSGGKGNYVRAELEDFLREVGLEHLEYNLIQGAHNIFEEYVKGYSLTRKLCTDTNVGMTLYFFDDEPLAYSYQSSRKSDAEYTFVSKPEVERLREFLLSFEENDYMDSITFLKEDEGFVDSDDRSSYVYSVSFNSEWMESVHLHRAYYRGLKVTQVERLRDKLHPYISQDVKITLTGGEVVVDCIREIDIHIHIDADLTGEHQ